jgi:hypothetical protein
MRHQIVDWLDDEEEDDRRDDEEGDERIDEVTNQKPAIVDGEIDSREVGRSANGCNERCDEVFDRR